MKKLLLQLTVFVAALIAFVVSTSVIVPSDKKLEVPKPVKDLSFLKTYGCIYELFDKEQWEANPGRSFDSNGVHLTKGAYHPVNACHYALFSYDQYENTKDEKYKQAFLKQVVYLRDSSKYKEYDNYKVGYPYLVSFHDLKAPWFSALAQSEAISVLIRYYAMTKDETVLPLIVKLRNFIVAPQSDGFGTMDTTPEGNIWFEEYPNSKQERQVLNGFFLSLVALNEYMHLFPGDAETKTYYEAALKSAKESIRFYDTGSWIKYNRGDGRLVSNGYLKWQILEMKFLYAMTADKFFENQYKIWSTYSYDKPYETQGCKKTNYNFSVPMKADANGVCKMFFKPVAVALYNTTSVATSNFTTVAEIRKCYDMSLGTFVWVKGLTTDSKEPQVTLNFKTPVVTGQAKLTGNQKKINSAVFYYPTDSAKTKWSKLSVKRVELDSVTAEFNFDAVTATAIRIQFEGIAEGDSAKLAGIELFSPVNKELPELTHYLTPVLETAGKDPVFHYEKDKLDQVSVFYRSGKDMNAVGKKFWDQRKTVDSNGKSKADTSDGQFYQFLLIGKPLSLEAKFSKVGLKYDKL